MQAVFMTATGGPDVLRLGEAPDPEPGPCQVRVRLKAAGVNPVDTKLRARGTYYPDQIPAILGCDGAGVVDAVGSAVTRFRAGDEVWFCNGGIGGDPGTYARYSLVHEDHLARKPRHLSFAEAAAAPLVLITAWESLHDRAALHKGATVLIHGGTGGVGHVAIQLAKASGARVITTVSSPEKEAFARLLGADAVVRYDERDFVQAVLDWTGGEGVDIALDTVGGPVFQRTCTAVRPYGDLVTLLQPGPEIDWRTARLRNLRFSLEMMLSPMYYGWQAARKHQASILEKCTPLTENGQLRISVSREFPLAQAAEAHRLLEAGGVSGKIVLVVD
jgi:NADPH2:quinone reductase